MSTTTHRFCRGRLVSLAFWTQLLLLLFLRSEAQEDCLSSQSCTPTTISHSHSTVPSHLMSTPIGSLLETVTENVSPQTQERAKLSSPGRKDKPSAREPSKRLLGDSLRNSSDPSRTSRLVAGLKRISSTMRRRSSKDGSVIAVWKDYERALKRVVELVLRQLLPIFLRSNLNAHISGPCTSALLQLTFGLRQIKTWAFQFLDATGKIPPGLMSGTLTSFGDFDQCLAARIPVQGDATRTAFRGQYCTIRSRPPLPPKPRYYAYEGTLPELANFSLAKDTVIRDLAKYIHVFFFGIKFRYDICLPSTCSRQDMETMLRSVRDYIDFEWDLELGACQTRRENDQALAWGQHVAMSILAVLLSLVLLSSALDMAKDILHPSFLAQFLESTTTFRALMAFSLPRNLGALFDTRLTFPKFRAMHGMRFLTMTWVILVSAYQDFNPHLFSNLLEFDSLRGLLFQPVFNATLSLDSFFFLSGLMVTYLTLVTIQQRGGKMDFKRQLWKRYLRVSPPYMLFMALCYLMAWEGGGSMWPEIAEPIVRNCNRNWWLNLLYVSNWFLHPKEYCIPPSYYFSCDMQLYVLGIGIAYILYKKPYWGRVTLCLMIAVSICANGIVTYFMGFPPTLVRSYPDRELINDYNQYLLYQFYCHLGAYTVGAGLGYFLYSCPNFKFTRFQLAMGWSASVILGLTMVYGTYEWNKMNGRIPNFAESILYAMFHRTLWAVCLAWIVATCVLGHGGLINRFLSWPAMVPFSRLTYMAFLFQWLLRTLMLATLRERITADHFTVLFLFVGLIAAVYVVSFGFTLVLDLPVINLRRLALESHSYKKSPLEAPQHRRPPLLRLTSNL